MKLTIKGKSGSLHQFIRKVKNSKGQTITYPKIKGERNPNNPKHWEWQLTWRDKIDDRWRSRCIRVKPDRALRVKQLILAGVDIAEIQAFINS